MPWQSEGIRHIGKRKYDLETGIQNKRTQKDSQMACSFAGGLEWTVQIEAGSQRKLKRYIQGKKSQTYRIYVGFEII